MMIYGSNEKEYHFLLKGHEDLRLDERVMQLFNLVNRLLLCHPKTEHKEELNSLKTQVNRLYDDNITDLKEFDKDKTKTIIDIQSMMNKLYMLLDQIKTLINDKR